MATADPSSAASPSNPLTLAPRAQQGPVGPGSWPLYGRNLANSRDGGRSGPTPAQARRLGPVWSFKSTVGDFTGTPVVVSGKVIAAAGSGTVFALDANHGRVRWAHDFHTYIAGSVAVAGGRVFVGLTVQPAGPTLAALRLSDGAVLWQRVVDTQPDADVYGSPTVADGTVYVGVSSELGEEQGHHSRGAVAAVDARSGGLKWHTYIVPPGYDGGAVWSTPALDRRRHRLYVGTGNAYHPPAYKTTDAILALDTRTGRIVSRYQATAGDIYRGGLDSADLDFGASPNLLGDGVLGEYQKSRIYWALDLRRFRPAWRRLTARIRSRVEPQAISSTAFDGQRIYGQTDYGQVFALDPRGRRLWITPRDGAENFSPVAVSNGVVYAIHSRGVMQARRASDGRLLASLPLGGRTWGGVSVVGGSVFVDTGDQFDTGYVVRYRPRGSR